MSVVAREETKPYSNLDDEEDALLNEAISCSRNLEIKTDDDEDEVEDSKEQLSIKDPKTVSIPWCDMESSDTSNSDLSNGRLSLSTTGGKLDLSANAKIENDRSLLDHNSSKLEEGEIKEESFVEKKIKDKMDTENDSGNTSPVRKRQREGEDEEEHQVTRNRRNSNSSSSTMSTNSKKNTEYETDPLVLARRQKDIDYGKNTIGYDRYTQEVPKDKRSKDHPRTPPMYLKYSRRGWDGMVKLWRKQLHTWDPKNGEEENKDDVQS
ncbi:hypothetical protein TSAR_003317 [Trichomalopsis sarcophagae]|uniref:Histone RNA hairpin-binding protein RNA-binding domain-containing protein n=1 Tax=Trichomalopsis sarcophagae TaxID=543379 RepID=A0A232F634_9HYME|nr:hypothetical protein TSAR_003317 [Trichomalopsis sarcophagae]